MGTASGERAGWSVSMMYDSLPALEAGRYNPMIAVGSPYYSKSVADFDWSMSTFAQRAAGVPIYIPVGGGAAGPPDAIDSERSRRLGLTYNARGLTSEGRVTVWQFNKVPVHKKHGYTTLEWLPRGKYSGRKLMTGTHELNEMGYSVAFSKTGDYLAVGCPGADGRFDIRDCEQLKAAGRSDKEFSHYGDVYYIGPDGNEDEANPDDYRFKYRYMPDHRSELCYSPDYSLFQGGGGNTGQPGDKDNFSGPGIGEVKTFRYVFEGEDGNAARQEHYLHDSREDVWIKYGPTIPGKGLLGEGNSNYYFQGSAEDLFFPPDQLPRYERPNFAQWGYAHRKEQIGERFGTDVSIIDVNVPMIAVGAPYAKDHRYDGWAGQCTEEKWAMFPTGRVDVYSSSPTKRRDSVMPLGVGGLRRTTPKFSSRTKPKLEFDSAGRVVASSGGGRESYFINPKVSGSGLADDNAQKSSRKTFGTGGINFTSSD